MASVRTLRKKIRDLSEHVKGLSITDGPEQLLGRFMIVPIGLLVPADWNYKRDDEYLSAKLAANLRRNGQVENLQVRELETGYLEVVNGNHRLQVLLEIGTSFVVVYNWGKISLAQAQRIAIETNETRFETDNLKLAGLLKEIETEFPASELSETMPYDEKEIDSLISLLDVPDYGSDGSGSGSGEGEKTVQITVKVSGSVRDLWNDLVGQHESKSAAFESAVRGALER